MSTSIPSGSKPIDAVGTSTAAFVGFTTKGPLDEPTLISSFDDYERLYGGIRDLDAAAEGDPMGFSVAAFFLNGGTKAYIVRVATTAAEKASGSIAESVGSPPGDVLTFEAVNEGEWGRSRTCERPRTVPRMRPSDTQEHWEVRSTLSPLSVLGTDGRAKRGKGPGQEKSDIRRRDSPQGHG